MKNSGFISIDEYVKEQIQLTLEALRTQDGNLDGRDLPALIPQIDHAYRSRAEIVSRYAKQVGLDVQIPACRRKDIGNEFSFFDSLRGHVHTEIGFTDAFQWLLSYQEAKEINESVHKDLALCGKKRVICL